MIFAFMLAATSWLGGTLSGVVGTLLSATLVWWAFVPPEWSFRIDEPRYAISTGTFVVLGLALSACQGRLRAANEALRLSEGRYSGFVAIASEAIVSVDPDANQKIVIFNKAAERIFGYAAEEVLGKPLDILIPERLRERHRQHVAAFASGGTTTRRMAERIEVHGLRKNGQEFPAEAAISRFPLGRSNVVTVALRDVTDQKRQHEEHRFLAEAGDTLAMSLDFQETVTNVARLAVRELADYCVLYLVDESGSISAVRAVSRDPSKAWVCELAVRPGTLPSKSFPIAWTVLDTRRPMVVPRVPPEVVERATPEAFAELLRAAAPTSVMGVPLFAHGTRVGAMVLVSSVPEREYGPDDVRLAEELGLRGGLAIENARLYGEARRAVRARDEVLGIVAHDLRNPLNAILLQCHAMVRHGPEVERRSHQRVDAVCRAATRMNRLIQDLLDVARIERGGLSIQQAVVSASEMASEAVEAQRPLAESSSLDIRLDVSGELPQVWADRERVLEVFENLIGNAIKFTKPGGHITVGANRQDHEDVFWVSDTGRGISTGDLPHVFERFWQSHQAEGRGAGLGLTIAKGIVEAHGGRIWAESVPGQGSTISFTIPTAPGAATEAPAS
jgi:PAS domain S-box-containing protein